MVKISLFLTAFNASVPITIETDRVRWSFVLTGPISTVNVPGNRVRALEIGGVEFLNVNVVADGVDWNLWDIVDFNDFLVVESISISAGYETNFCAF
jgi:hypothetical protein